jgi:CRISPR-associated protein Cas6
MSEPKVDLVFNVMGQRVPVDHGYALYAAVSKVLPKIHEDQDIALDLIRGRYVGDGLLDITPRTELVVRLPAGRISAVLALAGKSLDILAHAVRIGIPTTRALVPAAALYAHLVTTRNGNDQPRFEEEIRRQADALGIKGKLTVGERRTFGIHGKQVVGYSILASELTAEESIVLQENGLGGRRKMGCGFFKAGGD